MDIVLHGNRRLTLQNFADPEFNVVRDSERAHYSAIEMFHTSLGLCTFAVLAEYAERFDQPVDEVRIDLAWKFDDSPYRIGHIDMSVHWPGLPEARLKAVERAAKLCTIHNTLHHPPEIATSVDRA